VNETNSVLIDEDRPLPWVVFRDHPTSKDIAYVRSAASTGYCHREVCTLYNDACRHAQLLAAAPDLLAQLKAVRDWMDDPQINMRCPFSIEMASAIREAIAKAELQS